MVNLNYNVSKVKNQFLAVSSANLATVSVGCGLGWLSPALTILQTDKSPFETGSITIDQVSWLGSITYIGGLFGVTLSLTLARRFGRKIAISFFFLPLIIIWIMIIVATNINYLYASRFAVGLTMSGIFTCIPLMVSEIADDNVRGILGAFLIATQYLGILIGYIVGAFLPFSHVPYVMLPFPIIFFVTFFFVPESPSFLFKANRIEAAEKSLRFYKNCYGTSIEEVERFHREMDKLKATSDETDRTINKLKLKDFTTKPAIKAFSLAIPLAFFYAYCGSAPLIHYGTNIFRDSGSTFDANVSTIIMGSVQLIGATLAIILIDKFGRRLLFMISTIGAALGLCSVAIYSYCATNDYDIDGLSWIPVTFVSMALFSTCIGITPVTVVLFSEILPLKIRSTGYMLCLAMIGLFVFSVVKIFPLLSDSLGLYACLWFFSGTNLVGLLFSIFILKETKGTDINTMQ